MAKVEKVVNPPQKPTPRNNPQTLGLGFAGNDETITPKRNAPTRFTKPVPSIDEALGKHQTHSQPTPYRTALPNAPPIATHTAAIQLVFNCLLQ
jgi:hypothetical protein